MSEAVARQRLEDLRQRHGKAVYALAVHASLGAAVDAELLHHLRDNFLLDLAPPQRLPLTPDAEVQMARLLLSPLFSQIDDDLFEMDRNARDLLVQELAALDGGQRLRDVAALLERYTRERSGWQDWPELMNAQLLSAWAAIDPQSAREWLDAGRAGAVASGVGQSWYIAMRERLDRPSAEPGEPAEQSAPTDMEVTEALVAVFVGAAVGEQRPAAVVSGTGIRLTSTGLVVTPLHVVPSPDLGITVTPFGGVSRFLGEVIGIDSQRDIAFLSHTLTTGAPPAPLGHGAELREGDPVVIVGSDVSPELRKVTHYTTVLASGAYEILTADGPGPPGAGSALVGPNSKLAGIYRSRTDDGRGRSTPIEEVITALAASVDPERLHRVPSAAPPGDAELYLRTAAKATNLGRHGKAEQWANLALYIWQTSGDSAGMARAWVEHGHAVAPRDVYEAERSLATALDLLTRLEDPATRDELLSGVPPVARAVLGERAERLLARYPAGTWRAEQAASIPPELRELARSYHATRQRPPGARRIAEMDRVVEKIRGLPSRAELTATLARSPDPGLRLAAVVALQAAPSVELLGWLGERLSPAGDAPYVGYQAAVALRNAAEYLEDLDAVESAVRIGQAALGESRGTDRSRLLELTIDIIDKRRQREMRGAATGDWIEQDWQLWPNGSELSVGFLDEPGDLRNRIETLAHRWTVRAAIRFIFLPGVTTTGDLRISTTEHSPWGYEGAWARTVAAGAPTISLPRESAGHENFFRKSVLKMFGHALGLIQEHQSPNARIPWDREALYRYYTGAPYHWNREQVDEWWLRRYAFTSPPPYRPFDERSVMLHEIPAEFVGGHGIGGASELSESDVAFVAELYPRSGTRWWERGGGDGSS